jgi:nucleoprotein TPR
LQSTITTLEVSNRNNISLLDSKSAAYDRLAEELSTQQQKIIELRREVSELEEKLQKAENTSRSTKFREQTLQREVEHLKKSNDWHDEELKRRTTEHTKYRKEKGAQIAELQRVNEDLTQTVESLKRTESTLRIRVDEGSRKIEELHSRIQILEGDATKSLEAFNADLGNAQRLAELQQQRAATSQARLKEVEREREQIKDDAAEEIGLLQAEVESERIEKESLEQRVSELETNVETLESELTEARRNVPSTPRRGVNGTATHSTPARGASPSLFASPSGSRLKSGLSVTQLYSEHAQLKHDLQVERRRNEKLKVTVDEMIRDLEKHQPEFEEIRMDRERLQANLEELSTLLDETRKERDIARKDAKEFEGHADGLAKEAELLRQQLRDLSTQIKILLVEAQAREDGIENLSPVDQAILERAARGEVESSEIEGMSESGRLISQRLTVFRNIHELQEQNVKLLHLTRKLGEEMEGEEAKAKQNQQQRELQELEELRERVSKHQDEMKSLNIRAESYIRERDMFRRMLAHRGQLPADADLQSMFGESVNANPLAASAGPSITGSQVQTTQSANEAANFNRLLKEMQSQYDSYRQEAATDQASLKEQLNKVVKEKNELQAQIAKASSQITLAQERYELLHSNFNMLKAENGELQKRSTSLAEIATKQDIRTQQVAEELVEARSTVDGLRNENATLKAERELRKTIEARLGEDQNQLLEERSRLNKMISDLQSLQNERELTESETRRRLQNRTDSLESELQTTKRKLDEELEKYEKASQRREYEQDQYRTRVDDLTKGLSNTREELVAAKTQRDQLQSRVDELKIELRNAEEKTLVLQPLLTSRPTNASSSGNLDDQENRLTSEQELAIQVADLKRDLELTKNELLQANEHVDQYKSISQAAEEDLQSLTGTHDQYREDMNKIIAEKDDKIQDLNKRVEEISTELESSSAELLDLRSKQKESNSKFNDQKAILDSEISRLRDECDRLSQMSQLHQDDLKAQAEIAQRAQQSYEDELLKHAEAAKLLQATRVEYNQLKTEVAGYKADAEASKTTLHENEEVWAETKNRYEQEMTDLKSRREAVNDQNRRLHQQFETVSAQISALKQSHASTGDTSEQNDSGNNREEIITWLKNEKEIVEVQLELSVQEAKRYKQKLERTEAQLDESVEKLNQERQSQVDREQTSMSHSKLMESINQLNLFRESNASLRNDARQAQTQLVEKTKEVENLTTQLEPLRLRIRELENQLENNDGEIRLLQEDRDRWHKRTQDILQKYDRVDPAEMEALNNQITTLTAERDMLLEDKEKLQTQVNGIDERIKSATDELTQEFDKRRVRIVEQAKEKAREQNAVIREKTAQLEAVQKDLERVNSEFALVKAELEKAQESSAQPANEPTPANPLPTEATGQLDENTSSQLAEEQTRRALLEQEVNGLNVQVQELQSQVVSPQVHHRLILNTEQNQTELQSSLDASHKEKDELQALVTNAQANNVVDNAEAEQLRAELSTVRAELESSRHAPTTGHTVATTVGGVESEQLEELVAIRRAELEKDYEAKSAAAEQQFQARADKMKAALNNKLRELRQKDKEEADAKYNADMEQLKKEHEIEIERLKTEHSKGVQNLNSSSDSTLAAPATTTSEITQPVKTELTDAEIKDLVSKNQTIQEIIKRNILNTTKKSEERLREEFEKKMQDVTKAAQVAQDNAVSLEQKKQNVKLNMAEKKTRDAMAKIDVVDKAATETPQRPVGEVWAIAKQTKAVINTAASQVAAQPASVKQTPAPQNVQAAQKTVNATEQPSAPQPTEAATTSSDNVAVQNNQPTQNNASTTTTNSSLPTKPAQPQGAGAKVLGNLMSGNVQPTSGIPRFGAGRGGRGGHQHGDGGQSRGSGIPRGGARGRGQRGGGQINTTNQSGRGGGVVGATTAAPSGGPNSPLNPNAKQFNPGFGGAGNKRPHEDSTSGNVGKRARNQQ